MANTYGRLGMDQSSAARNKRKLEKITFRETKGMKHLFVSYIHTTNFSPKRSLTNFFSVDRNRVAAVDPSFHLHDLQTMFSFLSRVLLPLLLVPSCLVGAGRLGQPKVRRLPHFRNFHGASFDFYTSEASFTATSEENSVNLLWPRGAGDITLKRGTFQCSMSDAQLLTDKNYLNFVIGGKCDDGTGVVIVVDGDDWKERRLEDGLWDSLFDVYEGATLQVKGDELVVVRRDGSDGLGDPTMQFFASVAFEPK